MNQLSFYCLQKAFAVFAHSFPEMSQIGIEHMKYSQNDLENCAVDYIASAPTYPTPGGLSERKRTQPLKIE